ncbi:hypothetical protein [Burkholderia ubonensis]|uniref:hypothetical protein n=1 Tax=Burkholderia ubonensis TaxID=101571 RepID=UPI000B1F1301|nr:hypothetical protein [Burkholderia ubonensis]
MVASSKSQFVERLLFLQIARQNAKKNTKMKLSTRNDKISSSPGHIWTTKRLAIDRKLQVSFASLAWLALAFSANNSASFGRGIFEIVRRQVACYPRAVRAETGDGGDRDAIAADRGRIAAVTAVVRAIDQQGVDEPSADLRAMLKSMNEGVSQRLSDNAMLNTESKLIADIQELTGAEVPGPAVGRGAAAQAHRRGVPAIRACRRDGSAAARPDRHGRRMRRHARAARCVLRRDATPRPTSSAAATARYRIPYIGH